MKGKYKNLCSRQQFVKVNYGLRVEVEYCFNGKIERERERVTGGERERERERERE